MRVLILGSKAYSEAHDGDELNDTISPSKTVVYLGGVAVTWASNTKSCMGENTALDEKGK